jgi:DNA invertase Pin-like site-specific DNA recombinase
VSQLRELREYASRLGLKVIEEFIESKSAKTPGRPIFNQMLTAIENGEAEGIIAW